MGRVPYAQSTRVAVERVITVLRAELDTEIASALSGRPYSDLPMPAPRDEAIYHTEPLNLEEHVRNQGVAVFVYPDGPKRLVTQQSSGLNEYKATTEIDIVTILLFQYVLAQETTNLTDDEGVELTMEVEMAKRAELYTEALINCVCKYGCNTGEVHNITPLRDDSLTIYAEERVNLMGLAFASFTLQQLTNVPGRRPLP
jgi:hypothetical protein